MNSGSDAESISSFILKNANNRTLGNGTKKGLESDLNPNERKNSPGCLAALALNVPTDFLFRNFVSSKEKSSALCSLALDSSQRALRAGWFSNIRLNKSTKTRHKAGFRFAIKNSADCTTLELFTKILYEKIVNINNLKIYSMIKSYYAL